MSVAVTVPVTNSSDCNKQLRLTTLSRWRPMVVDHDQLNHPWQFITTATELKSAFSAWHCWLVNRKGIRPVKKLSSGVLAWFFVWSKVQTCIWPSWCHCHSLSLASVKSRLVLPFWYRLTWVVPEKRPLNRCVCVLLNLRYSLGLNIIDIHTSTKAKKHLHK